MTTEAKNSIALPNFVVEQPSSEDPGYKTWAGLSLYYSLVIITALINWKIVIQEVV
jgi:hypothetical protein